MSSLGSVGFGTSGSNPCVAVGNPQIDYVTEPAARNDGVHTFNAVGTDLGLFGLDARIEGIADIIFADSAVPVSDDAVTIEMDLTGVATGSYDLFIDNDSGSAALLAAIMVYDDPADLTRITVSPAGFIDGMAALPRTRLRRLTA